MAPVKLLNGVRALALAFRAPFHFEGQTQFVSNVEGPESAIFGLMLMMSPNDRTEATLPDAETGNRNRPGPAQSRHSVAE